MKNFIIRFNILSFLLISGILFIKCISDNNKENNLVKKKEDLNIVSNKKDAGEEINLNNPIKNRDDFDENHSSNYPDNEFCKTRDNKIRHNMLLG